jgi:hypothetical protein
MTDRPPATPAQPCIGADPACPCQDGDPCHYRDHEASGTKGWPLPATPAQPDTGAAERLAEIDRLINEADGQGQITSPDAEYRPSALAASTAARRAREEIGRLTAERDNLRAALREAIRIQDVQTAQVERVHRLAREHQTSVWSGWVRAALAGPDADRPHQTPSPASAPTLGGEAETKREAGGGHPPVAGEQPLPLDVTP